MLTSIRLQNFRRFTDSSFEFENSVNIIIGPNASGKTSILEAALTVLTGASYRVRDNDLIKNNSSWARVDCQISQNDSDYKKILKLERDQLSDKLNKTYEIDGRIYKRNPKPLPVVLFEPNNLQLLTALPSIRRDYLDNILTQITPGYSDLLSRYKRILMQRNNLLKKTSLENLTSQIFPWDIKLTETSGQINKQRNLITDQINQLVEDIYNKLSGGKHKILIEYKSQFKREVYESSMLKNLEDSLELDKIRGATSSGVHREDFAVNIDSKEIKEVASRGEVRSLTLSLKIIEKQILEKNLGIKPLLLFDDVLSELDGSRRHKLTDYLLGDQTIITTTDADIVTKNFMSKCNILSLP